MQFFSPVWYLFLQSNHRCPLFLQESSILLLGIRCKIIVFCLGFQGEKRLVESRGAQVVQDCFVSISAFSSPFPLNITQCWLLTVHLFDVPKEWMWLSWLTAVADWLVLARKMKEVSMMKMHSNV